MTQQINTTNLNDIANITLTEFKSQYNSGNNIAEYYYTELANQGSLTGNENIENYANLAKSVTTNSGVNGQLANAYSRNVADDNDVDFSVGSDSWKRKSN